MRVRPQSGGRDVTTTLNWAMTSALRKLTEAEYLASEETSPVKREYVDGFVYPLHAQAGATGKHNKIAAALFARLYLAARKKGCWAFASDMRVRVSDGPKYYYPDVLVTCEDLSDDARYAEAPCLIVEVLSETTRATDLGDKIRAYQSLPSLQGYLLVDTDVRAVRLFTREGEGWREGYWEGEGVVELPCVEAVLTLAEIYAGTKV